VAGLEEAMAGKTAEAWEAEKGVGGLVGGWEAEETAEAERAVELAAAGEKEAVMTELDLGVHLGLGEADMDGLRRSWFGWGPILIWASPSWTPKCPSA
jgi:hypothetical protein